MATVDLNEYEERLMLFLADRFNQGETRVSVGEFPDYNSLGREKLKPVIKRLVTFGFLTWKTNMRLTISAMVLEAAHQIQNPPVKDHWKDLGIKFRSQWWSIPVLLLVVIPPMVVGWVEVVKAVLSLFD